MTVANLSCDLVATSTEPHAHPRRRKPYQARTTQHLTGQCKVCEQVFHYTQIGAGRRRHFCSRPCYKEHFKQYRRGYQRRYYARHGTSRLKRYAGDCAICGKRFSSLDDRTTTCGLVCGRKLGAISLAPYIDAQKKATAERNTRTCERCQTSFVVQRSSDPGRYCSRSCHHSARRKYLTKADAKRAEYERHRLLHPPRQKIVRPPIECLGCRHAFTPKNDNRIYCSRSCAARTNRNLRVCATIELDCAECGDKFGAYRANQRYCSMTCRLLVQRRVHHTLERARKRTISNATVENVDPIAVFKRDQWTCRICGILTPPWNRGTYQSDAPELDHIIPVTRGGAHSYANTQCLCRDCNLWKGDRIL